MLMLSILFGGIVGVSLGLTGGGGSVFAVPMLAYGLGLPAREAVSVSLASVGITSFVGFLSKWRRGEAEIRTGLWFAIAGMVGAPLGTWIAGQVAESLLMLMFAGLMLLIAARMWKQVSPPAPRVPAESLAECAVDPVGPSCQRDSAGDLILSSRCARLLLLAGVASGVLSGMFGVGGGFIIVPALVIFSRMSMLRAVGTSLLVIAMVSVSGIVSRIGTGQSLNWNVTVLFIAGGLAGLWFGQQISHQLPPTALRRLFSSAILMVAMFVILRNLHAG